MKIYTKGGDEGEASLYNGQRRPKTNEIFTALGDVDELNSILGIAREHLGDLDQKAVEQLNVIQSRLLDVGSYLATPAESSTETKNKRVEFDSEATKQLESWIDAWDLQLPSLTNFILPSVAKTGCGYLGNIGGLASSTLHLARSVCRRAERSIVSVYKTPNYTQVSPAEDTESNMLGTTMAPAIMPYINRLSDYLFTVARIAAIRAKKEEVTYCKSRS